LGFFWALPIFFFPKLEPIRLGWKAFWRRVLGFKTFWGKGLLLSVLIGRFFAPIKPPILMRITSLNYLVGFLLGPIKGFFFPKYCSNSRKPHFRPGLLGANPLGRRSFNSPFLIGRGSSSPLNLYNPFWRLFLFFGPFFLRLDPVLI